MNSIVSNMKYPNTLKSFTKPNSLVVPYVVGVHEEPHFSSLFNQNNKIKNKAQTSNVQIKMKHNTGNVKECSKSISLGTNSKDIL